MILQGLLSCFSAQNLLTALLGTGVGIVIGALPGLGANIAMTLALPLSFGRPPDTCLILLSSLYCGATYGGSISAILLNTPGTPASGATTYDGYPLARQGHGDIAIGLSTMSSFIGGIFGTVLLITMAPLVTRLVLAFGPPQSFLIAILSLCIVGALGENRIIKGLITCGLGMMFSFVGMDVITGYPRFSYGTWYLGDGMNVTAMMIGIFAISEIMILMESGSGSISELANPGKLRNVLKGCRMTLDYPANLVKSSLIGSIIGAMPALGVTTASFLAYMTQANTKREGETPYGEGNVQGVIAPESSNNAVTATSLIPTLTMGIPGSSSMAIMLGAMTMHGLVPGPDLFAVNSELVYTVMSSFFLINIFMLVFGVLGGGYISRITTIQNRLLAPCVVVFCAVGAFALKGYWQDVILALATGFLGYAMKKYDYPIIGFILGAILGPIAERTFHQSLRISGGEISIFFQGTISKVLALMIVIAIFWPGIRRVLQRRKVKRA
ncbi:MAG: tripartite tricarboxylate transporter permease [Synergistaceae bacterium]|jgi:putative tricarboxylic transport membrane protein|nr:tripartite tricarboxylate transporter permease [Synergistaceae bacterium]